MSLPQQRTWDQLTRWDMARILGGVTVPNVVDGYHTKDLAERRDAAFISYIQMSDDKLREILREFMISEGLPFDTKWLSPVSITY